MNLVRQAILHFQEGNSDKLYEIDLCEVGTDQYVVNFRYGRRGSALKEGTKTDQPVNLQKAETIFRALEAEKTKKGYTAAGETAGETAAGTAGKVPVATNIALPEINWDEMPASKKKSVLIRLKNATEGKEPAPGSPHYWKTSRVIWMAGLMKWKEATPYILLLANKGDTMQRYSGVWALSRCGDEQAVPFILSVFKKASGSLQRIAGAGLVRLLAGEQKTEHLQHYLHALPEPFASVITNQQYDALSALLTDQVSHQEPLPYNFFENLYLLSSEHPRIKSILKKVLLHTPLRPNYFSHIRHLFKLAELTDDGDVMALLAHRFETENEMFRQAAGSNEEDRKIYVASLKTYVAPKKELAKKTSRLAYSDRTRNYLVRRTLRQLLYFGRYQSPGYVHLATGLLLAYDREKDYSAPFITPHWPDNIRHPANARCIYLNQILYGNSPRYQLLRKNIWRLVEPKIKSASGQSQTGKGSKPRDTEPQKHETIFEKIVHFFTGKKGVPHPVQNQPIPEEGKGPAEIKPVPNDAPFIELWNEQAQAYMRLLLEARMDEIHDFAMSNLLRHPEFARIREGIDLAVLEQLLASDFDIPAEFAYQLAVEKYAAHGFNAGLAQAMLYSPMEKARIKGREWVDAHPGILNDTGFVTALLLCPHPMVRVWIRNKLQIQVHYYTSEQMQAICGRIISAMLASPDNSESRNLILTDAATVLTGSFSGVLKNIGLGVAEDLIRSPVDAARLLGLDILLLKKGTIDFDVLSDSVFYSLLQHPAPALRQKGRELLNELSRNELLKRQKLVMDMAVSEFEEVRQGSRHFIGQMAEADRSFGIDAAEWLLPYLLRKESVPGLHKDVAAILSNELLPYLKNVNKEMVLRLLYSSWLPTQEFGIAVLEKYVDPNDFTLRQVIALGNHETAAVRQWSMKFFSSHVDRVKYEREEAIRLLDARWDDTRSFAKQYFREQFGEADWTPELLVGIADSVRPDLEAYGRELITRFFTEDKGEEYLAKLSQHPSEKMQLFATAYLERFAANDPVKLASLHFYFRSALMRVNKGRVAKNRIFRFLLEEGKKSEEAARIVARLIADISATVSVEDKARCIEIMLALKSLYPVNVPLVSQPFEERIQS